MIRKYSTILYLFERFLKEEDADNHASHFSTELKENAHDTSKEEIKEINKKKKEVGYDEQTKLFLELERKKDSVSKIPV
jgi:hypothetical protein